jgi:hypothetical protein
LGETRLRRGLSAVGLAGAPAVILEGLSVIFSGAPDTDDMLSLPVLSYSTQETTYRKSHIRRDCIPCFRFIEYENWIL